MFSHDPSSPLPSQAVAAQRRGTLIAALVLVGSVLTIALTGCATGDYAYVTRISTGERLQIPLERGSPVMAKKGTLSVRNAALVPNVVSREKELQYLFSLNDTGSVPLKSVRVDDVSDEKTNLMLEDLDPKLEKGNWTRVTRMYKGEERELSWVAHLDNSMRVFRFTVVKQDGTTTVLDQGWMVPGWAKVPMRSALGLK